MAGRRIIVKPIIHVAALLLSCTCFGQQYLGQLSENPFNPNSTSNQYGAGSPYNPNGVNNPHGRFGSRFSPNSVTNPHATDTPKLYDSQ